MNAGSFPRDGGYSGALRLDKTGFNYAQPVYANCNNYRHVFDLSLTDLRAATAEIKKL